MSDFVKDINVPANDCISRQAALMDYQGVCEGISCDECPFSIKEGTFTDCRLEKFILNLPSVQPQRPGRWLRDTNSNYEIRFICSECYEPLAVPTTNYKPIWNYCPHCGAKMEEDDEWFN